MTATSQRVTSRTSLYPPHLARQSSQCKPLPPSPLTCLFVFLLPLRTTSRSHSVYLDRNAGYSSEEGHKIGVAHTEIVPKVRNDPLSHSHHLPLPPPFQCPSPADNPHVSLSLSLPPPNLAGSYPRPSTDSTHSTQTLPLDGYPSTRPRRREPVQTRCGVPRQEVGTERDKGPVRLLVGV